MYEEIFESIRAAAAKRNLKESTAGAYCRTVKYFKNGLVSGILKGLLLGIVCFAISYGMELAIFILQGNPAHLELYISSFR